MPGSVRVEQGNAIMISPAILDDPDHFVWGACVIRGEDGRYRMFYSIWDTGPDKPPFQEKIKPKG